MVQEAGVQSQVESYQRLKKWYLMPPCLTLSIIRWGIKGKVEYSWERSSALPLQLGVVAIEKGAFWSPSTKFANLLSLEIVLYMFFFWLVGRNNETSIKQGRFLFKKRRGKKTFLACVK